MVHVTDFFGIAGPVEFLDVHVERDNPLFLDPVAIRRDAGGGGPLALRADSRLRQYFGEVTNAARAGDRRGRQTLKHLHEPNETRLGLSIARPRGSSLADELEEILWRELVRNPACRAAVLTQLEDLPLFVRGIGSDRVSDIATRVVFDIIADFTADMMRKHPALQAGRTTENTMVWDEAAMNWAGRDFVLPFAHDKQLLLIPRSWVYWRSLLDRDQFYNRYTSEMIYRENGGKKNKLLSKREVKSNNPDKVLVNNKKAVEYKTEHSQDLVKAYRKQAEDEFVPLSASAARSRIGG